MRLFLVLLCLLAVLSALLCVSGRPKDDMNGVWKQISSASSASSNPSSAGGAEIPFGELLALFRRRQLAHAQHEEQRRSTAFEAGETPAPALLCLSLRDELRV